MARDVGRVLLHALQDLKSIRHELAGGAVGPESDEIVDGVLARAEHDLRAKAEALSEVLLRGEPDDVGSSKTGRPYAGPGPSTLRGGANQRARYIAEQSVRESQKARMIARPTSELAREFLHERYGLPLPTQQQAPRAAGGSATLDNTRKGLKSAITVKPGTVLPKHMREDPFAELPPLEEGEIRHGVYNLLNRGLLPSTIDLGATLSTGGAAISAGGALLHDTRFSGGRTGPAATSIDTGAYNQYKLDLLPPPPVPMRRQASGAGSPQKKDPAGFGGGSIIPEPPVLGGGTAAHPREPSGVPLGDGRGYEEMLDTFSLHEFLIRRGETLDSTPEFLSFKRAYQSQWAAIADLIIQLESLCVEYAVPLAVVDGKSLASLAMLEGKRALALGEPVQAPLDDLLSCVQNIESVAELLGKPGARFRGPQGVDAAAVKIQTKYRGHQARKHVEEVKLRDSSIVPIQQRVRVFLQRRAALRAMRQRKEDVRARFDQLQDNFREEWPRIQKGHRVAIHLNSLSITPEQRLRMHGLPVRQNAQMTRLVNLAEPNLDVVYVSPFRLSEDLEGYFLKLLQVGGVEDASDHYRVVHPEEHTSFPPHLSLAELVWYSPTTLRRIRSFVKGRPAYIVPGQMGDVERELAVYLGIPILGPSPETSAMLGTKSGALRLFTAAEMNTAPGVILPPRRAPPVMMPLPPAATALPSSPSDLTTAAILKRLDSSSDVTLACLLAGLMAEQPDTPRFIFKLDNEMGGRGHAYVDVGSLPETEDVLEPLRNDVKDERKLVVALERLTMMIERILPSRVTLCSPATYPSWSAFEAAAIEYGCVIEPCPEMVTGSPSANIFIAPNGAVEVVSTHEQIFCPAYRFIGASFPQSSVPHGALSAASRAIGEQLAQVGVFGHVGIDYVALRSDRVLRLWAVDLNLRITSTQSSFELFNFVTGGTFDPETGVYLAPMTPEEDAAAAAAAATTTGDEDEHDDNEDRACDEPSDVMRRRFYVVADFMTHSNLGSVQYAAFFNRCRLEGVCFDMHAVAGTIFNLYDSFASGTIGLLCVGRSPHEAFNELAGALDFIARQVGPGTPASVEDGEVANTFHHTLSTIKYLADKLKAGSGGER